FASAEPCATIGSRKHLRRSTSVQLPLSGLFAEQSELLRQLTMPVPSGRTRPSQVFSSGPVAHCASSVPGIASQTPPLHWFGCGGTPDPPIFVHADAVPAPPSE